jgi:flagellar biosynthesis/type III secretory pathway protein FliH
MTTIEMPAAAGTTHRRGWLLPAGLTLLAVIAACGIAAGAFFGGRATRQSDDQVTARIAAAKAGQARADKVLYTRRMTAALSDQRKTLKKQAARRAEKAQQQGFASGQAQGYSSGQAVGLKDGHAKGRRQGRREGYTYGALDGYTAGYDKGSCDSSEYVC